MKRQYTFTQLFFIGIFLSCNQQTPQQKDKEKYTFLKTLDLAKDSTFETKTISLINPTYRYSVTNVIETNLEVNGKEVENKNSSEIEFLYNLSNSKQNGTKTIKITFEKFKIKTKKGDLETEINADNAGSIEPIEQFISGIKGSTLEVFIDKTGHVTSEEGIRNFTNTLFSKMPNGGVNVKDQIKVQVSKLLGGSFLKNSIELGIGILPDKPVAIGDNWIKNYNTEMDGINLSTNTKYSLLSVDHNIASIEATSEIQNATPTNSSNDNSLMSPSELNGNQDSEFEINIENGLLINERTSSEIKGDMKVMGRTIPIKIKMKKKVVGTKI